MFMCPLDVERERVASRLEMKEIVFPVTRTASIETRQTDI